MPPTLLADEKLRCIHMLFLMKKKKGKNIPLRAELRSMENNSWADEELSSN